MNLASQTVIYGSHTITYDLNYSDRNTLDISVHPNKRVVVTAPMDTEPDAVEDRVKHRARWILKQQQFFNQFLPRTVERQYVSGETHLYLGRQYRLKIIPAETSAVKLIQGRIQIYTSHPEDTINNKQLLRQWYRDRASLKFSKRLELCLQPFQRRGYEQPDLYIRQLSKRWGSLTTKGRLLLNLDLIRASTHEIDYVITHELCHMVYHDHSTYFYDLLTRIMPDWKKRKLSLERRLS